MSFQPADPPAPKMTQATAVMPEPAVAPIAKFIHTVELISPVKPGHNGDHLVMPQSRFKIKLIIADTGIPLPRLHDPVQNIVSIVPLVQGQVILFQLLRPRRQHDAVNSLPQHRQHADPPGRKLHRLPRSQILPDQGHQLIQLYLTFK